MPTNPGNIVRIRSRKGGRASVYESNMWAQKFTGGLFSGNGVRQNTSADMNILVGGASTNPDVVIGQNPAGYNIALDLVSTQTIAITKPASNSRITAIVAYTNDLSLTSADAGTTGSPSSCGLLVVNGASSASPVAPTDSDIRAAITADGATGSQATYCVVATILVASTTTTITNTLISTRRAQLSTAALANSSVTSDKIDFTTLYSAGVWWEEIGRAKLVGDLTGGTTLSVPIPVGKRKKFYQVIATLGRMPAPTGSVWPSLRIQHTGAIYRNVASMVDNSSTVTGQNGLFGFFAEVRTSEYNAATMTAFVTKGNDGDYPSFTSQSGSPIYVKNSGGWIENSAVINTFTLVLPSAGWRDGTEIVVLGHD